MQSTSATYQGILAGPYSTDVRVRITGTDNAEHIVTVAELSGPVAITEGVFDTSYGIGNAVSAEIELSMLVPADWTPKRMARVRPQVRITNGQQTSEWISRGVFFIDTRQQTKNLSGENVLMLHGYDRMLMSEQMYAEVNWATKRDYAVVQEICTMIGNGWTLDPDTLTYMQSLPAVTIKTPYNFTYREVLQSIAAIRCGNFVFDDMGRLKLIPLNSAPASGHYLITENGDIITLGGTAIVI